VTGYLRPAIELGAVELWIDRMMLGGADWEREIASKLRACDIFVLLVSRHSLSSGYVLDEEVAIIRERQAKGEDVHFYPLVLTPTPDIGLDLVRDKNLRPRDGKAFFDYSLSDRYRHMNEAANEIAKIAEEIAERRGARPSVLVASTSQTEHALGLKPGVSTEQSVSPGSMVKSALRMSVGERGRFTTSRRRNLYRLFRTLFLRIENIGNERSIQNIRIPILSIVPQDEYEGPWLLAEGLHIAAGAEEYIPFLAFGEPDTSNDRQYDSADTFIDVLTHSVVKPALPRDTPQYITVRATGVETPPCDFRCKVWVDKTEGRLRIEASDPIAGEIQSPQPIFTPPITNQDSLKSWLSGERREVAVAIAARAALRVSTLAVRVTRSGLSMEVQQQLAILAGEIFRAVAAARVSARYATVGYDSKYLKKATEFKSPALKVMTAGKGKAPVYAAAAACDAAAAAVELAPAGRIAAAIAAAAAAVANSAGAFASADASETEEYAKIAAWEQTRVDAMLAQRLGVNGLLDSPLWSLDPPRWAVPAFYSLRESLPPNQDWEVWFEWYEERWRGGSRGEAYELVFATVPLDVWDRGPAAANAWIKEHLTEHLSVSVAVSEELPEPLPDFDSPFTYGWNTKLRVEVVAGAQNLPFYSYFSSEEDHRHALEACRVGGERLLKALRGRRYNARKEYSEALEYYLEDLPKTAGTGNILLANVQVRILRAMFLADAAMLPVGKPAQECDRQPVRA
jgi:hypothetical protein